MSDRHSHPHDHSHYSMGQLSSHERSWHEEPGEYGPREEHQHFTKLKCGPNDAARIDVHPKAMPRFEGAKVIFAVMEGCLKADAVLTAIRNNDLNASVYSFPSVTLGNCPELPDFAEKYLKGKTVIAVLDADWADPSKEGAVENQGRIYQGKLLALGIKSVHLAAPPQDPKDEHGHPIFKGVDDFLGAGKGGLHELVCIDVKPPKNVEKWVRAWDDEKCISVRESGNPYTKMRSDGLSKITNILTSMAVFAGGSGLISVTLSCMANAMGVSHQRVSEVVQNLETMGAVHVDGELYTGPSFFGGGEDWVERPTITIMPKELRAVELPHRTTGSEDVLGASFFGGRA